MKFKNLAALVCGVMILNSSICLAEVDGSKIVIGGISPGMSETKLIDAFGQPTYRDGDEWTYKTFKVEVKRGIVKEVSTCTTSIITPVGVRVGQAAEILNTTLGKADKVENDGNGVEYEYFSTDGTKKMEFKVVNGIISKITCEIRD